MKQLKNWIIAHKLLSIIIAAVILVGATCAIVLPIALSHKHEFATTWTYDGESHWHACTGKKCEEVNGKEPHAYDNECDDSCNVCGLARTAPHAFSETWTKDAENHWRACANEGCNVIHDSEAHDFATWSVKTEADYGVDRVETTTCTVCTYNAEKTIEKSSLEYTGDFYMMIRDVLNITGRGVVVMGKVDRGTVKVGDKVSIGGCKNQLTVHAIGINNEEIQEAIYGDEISILLGNDVSKEDIAKGQPIYATGTLTQHTTFTAEIYLKTEEEGGKKSPIFSNYAPIFKINGLTIKGVIKLADGATIRPGETATITIVLNSATYLREKLEFSAEEGGKNVLTGVVLSVEHVYDDSETVCTDCGYDSAGTTK